MKKFWLILLSLGLIMAFSVSAFAVDVKVSGEYFAGGMYINKMAVEDDGYGGKNYQDSTAFYFQRLRVGTDFIVSPCLKLVTRFDAMERIWGGARGESNISSYGGADAGSAGTREENQNIAFDYAYIDYVSPIGTFDIGYGSYGATGTVFANSATAVGSIKYKYDFTKVPASLMLGISKVKDTSASAVSTSTDWTDGDKDMYGIEGVYNFKNDKAAGKVGAKLSFYRYADTKPASNYITDYYQLTPYVMATIGPVFVQAELNWGFGDKKDFDTVDTSGNQKLDQLNVFIDATAKFGMFYAGGSFAYVSGDDPNSTDKDEGAGNTGGNDYNPCLLLFNYDVTYWAGNIPGHKAAYSSTTGAATRGVVNGPMMNAWFFQGRVGVKPVPEADIMLSVSYATADKKPGDKAAGEYYVNSTYGTEVDLVGTYKITNNLSYMLGAGYLFTGDYFKGYDPDHNIQDDFILINKLTLTF
jgi:hypothetical protein